MRDHNALLVEEYAVRRAVPHMMRVNPAMRIDDEELITFEAWARREGAARRSAKSSRVGKGRDILKLPRNRPSPDTELRLHRPIGIRRLSVNPRVVISAKKTVAKGRRFERHAAWTKSQLKICSLVRPNVEGLWAVPMNNGGSDCRARLKASLVSEMGGNPSPRFTVDEGLST